ncbi:aminoacyl-histidine dipeptidase [uncultured Clostridium sp.]|uniref:aminoacyl-histidine dipeptidase n=1 Tax=uncultured Clostridium sp. TaxID=59620 RepID=UPI002632E5C3|nr:aminoacyl-histidine dipeptidase [uncultured Clostridium sp.]
MRVLEELQPYDVFKYFEEITQIPRGSGNEQAISDYLVKFANELNLEVIQDEANNIVIRKEASKGYENAKGVIIQGHMDMVCEKNKGTEHDFEKDPLKLRIVEDNIYATDTTLGADNGIAVAYGMAVLAGNYEHPALELLVTTDEEVGMSGAIALDGKNIKGQILLNADSEVEGELLVSCAGGARNTLVIDIDWTQTPEEKVAYELRVKGLRGGHSGMEINKARGNANKLMGRLLNEIYKVVDFDMALISGGSKNNAIPREADTLVVIDEKDIAIMSEIVEKVENEIKAELRVQDPNVIVEMVKEEAMPLEIFSKETKRKVIMGLQLMPNGVEVMSMDMDGLVQTSTNLGVVTTTNETVSFDSATRSSVNSQKWAFLDKIQNVADVIGAKLEVSSSYPSWEYNPESEVREIAKKVYKDMTGEDAKLVAIHAGVECGLLSEKVEAGLDMISFGPNMADVHTPDEHVSISSIKNVWEFLIELLKALK